MPRQILPNSTYLITRRCTQRQFLLRPSAVVNRIFLYCLAMAAAIAKVQVHTVCVMSNHWHAVITDIHARLPVFLEWLHKYVSKCLNVLLGRRENLWSSDRCSVVLLDSAEAVLEKIVYVLANPVSAGLVNSTSAWPGLHTASTPYGEELEAARPEVYFSPTGKMPPFAKLKLTRPPCFAHLTDEEFTRLVRERLEIRENELRAAFARRGRRFLGRKRCLRMNPFARPRTRELRRELNPKFAGRDREHRIHLVERFKRFIQAYRAAYAKWKAGKRNVLFPNGTYWLRVHAGVRCAALPP